MMVLFSPPDEIRLSAWFDEAVHTYKKDGMQIPNRLSQIKYAIQGGVDDDFISTRLGTDIQRHLKTLITIYSKLNGYTHIVESTFGVCSSKATIVIENSLKAVLKFLRLIRKFRKELYTNLETKVFDAIRLQ
jgi:hypothetical protein